MLNLNLPRLQCLADLIPLSPYSASVIHLFLHLPGVFRPHKDFWREVKGFYRSTSWYESSTWYVFSGMGSPTRRKVDRCLIRRLNLSCPPDAVRICSGSSSAESRDGATTSMTRPFCLFVSEEGMFITSMKLPGPVTGKQVFIFRAWYPNPSTAHVNDM